MIVTIPATSDIALPPECSVMLFLTDDDVNHAADIEECSSLMVAHLIG